MAGNLYKWRLSTGGSAGVAGNWTDLVNGSPSSTLPGSADEVEFANTGGTITGGLTVSEWVIASTAGFYTFTGNATATDFGIAASASLLGTWTQAGTGEITIAGGVFTLGSGASLISDNTDGSILALVVDGTLVSNGGTVTADGVLGIGATGTGLTGTGTLSAGAGSSLTAAVVQVGNNSGSSGTLALSDGASASVSEYLALGAAVGSTGTLTVAGGAMLTALELFDGAGGSGEMDVSGTGSTATIGTGGLVVGDGANGSLTVENGATLADSGLVDVGLGGTGTLTVRTGGQLVSVGADIGRLASTTPGSGTVLLDASKWTSSGEVVVGAGANGSALLQIEDGATLQASATLAAGTPFLLVDENVAGQAVVDVGDAVVNAGSNSVDIGEAGFGTLTLNDGAVLDAGSTGGGLAFLLGDQANAGGTATLTGFATTVHVTGDATIGASGAGSLSIGGIFSTTGGMDLGVAQSGSGVVTVAGAGSDLAIGGQLDIGGGSQAGGTGTLTVGTAGVLTAESLVLYAGGTLTVGVTGRAEIGNSASALAGQLVVDAGVTAGGSGEVVAPVTNQGTLVAQGGTLVVTGLATGGGSYEVASGATLQLDQPGQANLGFFGTSGTIVLGTASGAVDVLQMSGGDTLRLVGLGSNPEVSYSGDTATVAGSLGSWSLTFGGAPPTLHVSTQGNDALVLACYVEGTLIGTPEGPMPIEDLAVGDRVLTFAGPARAIVWLGRCVVDCRNHPQPRRVWPVRVAPHAFGPGMPTRSLFLSPDHAVFVDEVLIPVRYLIDGYAIRQVERTVVTYWHLELDSHDVVLAEGLPAESFLGDHERFDAVARLGLYPDFTNLHWEACGYAPLVVTGSALARVRARIGAEELT
jgi:collagen type I alpha